MSEYFDNWSVNIQRAQRAPERADMGLFMGISLLAWTVAIILLYTLGAGLAVEKGEKAATDNMRNKD